MTGSIRISQVPILRRLVRGYIPNRELRGLDQRPLRGLFLAGAFRLTANLDAQITQVGWNLYKTVQTRNLRERQNDKAPLFHPCSNMPSMRQVMRTGRRRA